MKVYKIWNWSGNKVRREYQTTPCREAKNVENLCGLKKKKRSRIKQQIYINSVFYETAIIANLCLKTCKTYFGQIYIKSFIHRYQIVVSEEIARGNTERIVCSWKERKKNTTNSSPLHDSKNHTQSNKVSHNSSENNITNSPTLLKDHVIKLNLAEHLTLCVITQGL